VTVAESVRTVTRKGQVTVPIEIRRALGIKEGDKIAFELETNGARFKRRVSYVESTAGIVKSKRRPLTAEQLRESAENAIAADLVERTRR
jgi:AbrB family looped-hinge helix DNA binding protein